MSTRSAGGSFATGALRRYNPPMEFKPLLPDELPFEAEKALEHFGFLNSLRIDWGLEEYRVGLAKILTRAPEDSACADAALRYLLGNRGLAQAAMLNPGLFDFSDLLSRPHPLWETLVDLGRIEPLKTLFSAGLLDESKTTSVPNGLPIVSYCCLDDRALALWLVENGCEIGQSDSDGDNLLHVLTYRDWEPNSEELAAQAILRSPGLLRKPNSAGLAPARLALRNGCPQGAVWLAGHDPDAGPEEWSLLLAEALEAGDKAAAAGFERLLLAHAGPARCASKKPAL